MKPIDKLIEKYGREVTEGALISLNLPIINNLTSDLQAFWNDVLAVLRTGETDE